MLAAVAATFHIPLTELRQGMPLWEVSELVDMLREMQKAASK